MDIIAQLKAERDKAAQQVNALDTAIRALSGMNSTRGTIEPRRRISAARSRSSCKVGQGERTEEGCSNCL